MKANISQMDEHKWLCELWPLEDEDNKFSGIMSYSPSGGIEIEALAACDAYDFDKAAVLHGNSYDLGKFTLMGCFEKTYSQTRALKSAKIGAIYLIVGGHFLAGQKFSSCSFQINDISIIEELKNLPQKASGIKNKLLRGTYKGLDVCLEESWQAGLFEPNNLIAVDNNFDEIKVDDELKELKRNIATFKKDSDANSLFYKKSPIYQFTLSGVGELSVHDFHKDIKGITNLLAVLSLKKCVSVEVSLFTDSKNRFAVLQSCYLSDKDVQQITSQKRNPFRDVHYEVLAANFQKTLDVWEDVTDSSIDLIGRTFSGYINDNQDPVQLLILAISALEQWHDRYEKDEGGAGQYDYMINTYATDDMKVDIEEHSPLKLKGTLGKLLSNIRGVIVHPKAIRGYKFKAGRNFDDTALFNLVEVIVLTLLGALYSRFGYQKSVLDGFYKFRKVYEEVDL